MRPLTLDDLLPLNEYAGRRQEFFDSFNRYLDRYRRIRVGPRLALLFENRQTLWFRLQELLRVARLAEPERIQQELDLYNRLLPGRQSLQAALLIDIEDEARLTDELAFWQTLDGSSLKLCAADHRIPAQLVTCRPEDRAIGTSHWIQFHVDADGRKGLGDSRHSAYFEIAHHSYQHTSAALSDEVRQSLMDDLELSDRDDKAA
jgi:hypothetical protein